MSKELVFKVVLEGDTKDYVSNIQQSEATTKAVFDAIKQEADKLRQASAETAKQIGEIVPESTTKMASALTQNLNNTTTAIQNAGTNAGATAKNFSEFGRVSEQALGVLKSDLVQAKQKLQEFASTNATPQDIARAQAEVDKLEKEVEQADAAFNKFEGAVLNANKEVRSTESASFTAQNGINGIKFAVNALVGAMAALGVGLGIKELAEAADSYAMLSAKIQQSTKDSGNFEQAIAGVHQIALQTNSSLDATAGLFTKLNTVAKDMGQTQQYALDMTSTVTKAIQLGGGSAQASEAAVQQFIQAMQGGVLRGEEFNSIMENGYGLAEALAKGLGVTTGELRKMAENGELSAERVLAALAKQKAGVDAQYAEMPLTISNALQKIATSWQILIGEMDQANGASATVANALSVIADNLGILKVFFDDVAAGVGYLSSKFSDIDPTVLNSLRDTLTQLYENFKQNLQYIVQFGETAWSAFTSALDAAAPLFNTLLGGGENVSGLTTLMNVLRVAMAAVSDVTFGLNVGFKVCLAAVQFLAGGIYSLSAATLKYIPFMGELADQAQNASDRMFAQAEKNMGEVNKLTQDHKWNIVEAYNEIGKTEEQKSAERVANNQKTLTELKAQEEKHRADYGAISTARIQAEQQLLEARKSGNQAAIDLALKGIAEVDKMEKAYQAESKKIIDAKIAAAQAVAEATIRSADAAGQAELKALNAKLAAQGLKAEFDSTGKVVVSAMGDATNATEKVGTTAEQSATKVRKAASALGIDLDVSLNRVSEKFREGEKSVDDFSGGLESMGVTGQKAADVTYEAWQKWAEQAKSPAEIDAAKAKLIEFEKQGVLSAKQVEMGMRYLDEVNGKLPANISEVEKSYKLLGITSREEANKMAASLMKAFDVTVQSGTASAENIKQALINMADKIYASGDAAKIAWYEAQLSANGLKSSVDSLGKASVKTIDDLSDSVDRVGRTARGSAADGFRELGRVAKQEAEDVAETWEQAMARVDKERKAQSASNSKGLSELQGGIDQMAEDYYKRLVAAGMNASQARDKADKAKYSLAVETTNSLKGGTTTGLNTTKQEMEKTLAYWESKNSSNAGGGSISTGGNSKAPVISAPNIQAPSIAAPQMPNITDLSDPKNVRLEIAIGNSSTELYGTQDQVNATEALFRELEQAKKAM